MFGLPSGNAITLFEVSRLISSIVQFVFAVSMTIVLGFIVYGGFRMATAGGDDKAFGEGKKTLINAMIGLAVVLGLGVIVATISRFAQNPSSILY